MAYKTVLVNQEEHVGVITLNRPEVMNTLHFWRNENRCGRKNRVGER
ncbi:MAG: hypothetical protein JRD04_06090 [Deltaproteobacteria bacterium]|nr:hypothetical protein [Deltaproteobacteria bacterium]